MYGPDALTGVLMIVSVLVSIKKIVSRRLFPWGENFHGADLRCVLDVAVVGSGAMDLWLRS